VLDGGTNPTPVVKQKKQVDHLMLFKKKMTKKFMESEMQKSQEGLLFKSSLDKNNKSSKFDSSRKSGMKSSSTSLKQSPT